MSGFTHFDANGKAAMVDVSAKDVTSRQAIAKGAVVMAPETAAMVAQGTAQKGDVLGIARVAGIMAAKRTADLIPLCHPLALSKVTLSLEVGLDRVEIQATAKVSGQTGVEMEALTAVSVAALTIYDMCKAVDRAMRIENVRLVRKEGGKSGLYEAD